MTNDLELTKNQLVFHSKDGEISLDVMLKGNSIWLSLNQLADLFHRDKSVISRHLSQIFKTKELRKGEAVANYATTAADGKTYRVDHYNLDAILSVGYRINSKRGTEFRRWATQVLNQHLLKGYTLNQQRLSEKSLKEITSALNLLQRSLKESGEITDIGESALEIIQHFAKAWHLLLAYDENKLENPSDLEVPPLLDEEEAEESIASLAKELKEKGEASNLFAKPRNHGIKEILGNIHQTFGQE